MSNDSGFSLVSFSLTLPVILSVVFGLLLSTSLLLRHRQNQHLCQKKILQLQIRQSNHLRHLLKLNKKARSLRQQRKMADQLLSKATQTGQPKAIMAAKAIQMAVKGQQLVLRIKQRSIIAGAEQDLTQSLTTIKSDYSKDQGSASPLRQPSSLPVMAKGITTDSPTYHPLPNIEVLQTVALKWTWPLPKAWHNLMDHLDIKSKKLVGYCAGTLRKRSRQWRGELTAFTQTNRVDLQ